MLIKGRYEYDPSTDLLGRGGFARVFRARDQLLNREVALKVFSKMGHDQYSVLSEIRKAIQLEHPNLLRYYDVLLLEQSNALGEAEELQIGVMEYANAGDLKSYVQANPGTEVLTRFLREILTGLEYLHSHGIIHRDLKAQNILLVKRGGNLTAKISDFGISKDLSGEDAGSSSALVGTIEYMAPEQFNPRKFGIDGKVRPNVDLWAFGVMVHELLTDTTPFGQRDGDTTAEQIMAAILDPELPAQLNALSEPFRSVVKKCLVADAKERIQKASELLSYFGEPEPGTAAFAAGPSDTIRLDNRQHGRAGSEQRGKSRVPSQNSDGGDDETRMFNPDPGNNAASEPRTADGQPLEPKYDGADLEPALPLHGFSLFRRWRTSRKALIGTLLVASVIGLAAFLALTTSISLSLNPGPLVTSAGQSAREFATDSMLTVMSMRENKCVATCIGQPASDPENWPGSWSEPYLVGDVTHTLPDDGKEHAGRVARYFCRAADSVGMVTLHQRGECVGLKCTSDVYASCFESQPPTKNAGRARVCRSECKQQTNME